MVLAIDKLLTFPSFCEGFLVERFINIFEFIIFQLNLKVCNVFFFLSKVLEALPSASDTEPFWRLKAYDK